MTLTRAQKLIGLGLAATGLAALLALNVRESRTIVVEAQPATLQTNTSGTLVGAMEAPRYSGRSANGTEWNLTAATANQIGSGQTGEHIPSHATGELRLTQLAATFTRPDEEPLSIASQAATYQPHTTQLTLPEGTDISGTLGGYTVVLQAAQANAELSATTLRLTGGVSATLWAR